MKKIAKLIIFGAIALVFSSSIYSVDKKRIAVMPFEYGGGISKEEAAYLTEKVRNALINTGLFEVISNDQIENMMAMEAKKQGVGSGSCNTEQCIIDLGNALECEKMLIGKASGAFGEFSVSGKILDVVSQQYEKAQDVTISNKNDFPEAARNMVSRLTSKYKDGQDDIEPEPEPEAETVEKPTPAGVKAHYGMLWRTVLLPGLGHLYMNQDRGWAYGGVWLAATGAFIWSQSNFAGKKDDYMNATEDFDPKFTAYQNAASTRRLMSFVFAGSYLLAFADIFISQKAYVSTGVLWRTALLPGWGHLHMNQDRGWAYGGIWLAAMGAFIWSQSNYAGKKDDYMNATENFDSKFSAYESAAKTRQLMSVAFVASYAIVFLDMLILGKSFNAYAKNYNGPDNLKILPYLSKTTVHHTRFSPEYDAGLKILFQRSIQ
ncbi:MAG: penicillin-binding protein activator LpoB [Spirochaetia bacterium]|nr:penicillin-binding protein activator LpoB [Spirochaetia bacterium]